MNKRASAWRRKRTGRPGWRTPPERRGGENASILKVGRDEQDGKRELEFELDYLATLTVQERFEMMFRRSRQIREMLERHGHRKPAEIVKRS